MKLLSKIFGITGDEQAGGKLIFHPSETCPECGTKLASLRSQDSAWHCPNLDCPAQVRERIEHWCSSDAMDIALADKPLVAQLVKQGLVHDVAEMYSVKPGEVAALEGRDKQLARDFLEQLTASKSREAWRALYGLSIPHADAEVARQLCRHFAALDDVLTAGPERMMKQAAVTEAVARSIAHWYGDGVNRRLVRRLQKAGINFRTGT